MASSSILWMVLAVLLPEPLVGLTHQRVEPQVLGSGEIPAHCGTGNTCKSTHEAVICANVQDVGDKEQTGLHQDFFDVNGKNKERTQWLSSMLNNTSFGYCVNMAEAHNYQCQKGAIGCECKFFNCEGSNACSTMNFNMLALGKEYSRSCLQPCFGHCCAKKIKNCGNELNQESDLIAKPQDRKYWRSRALRAEDKLQSLREQCLGPQASRKSRYPTVFLSTFSREMSSYPSSFPSKFPSGHPVTGSPFTGNPTTLPTEFPSLSPKTLNPASLAPTPFPTGTPTVTITYSPSTSAPKTGTPSGHPVSASPLTASPLTVNPLTVHPTSFPTAYPSKSPATATPLTANPLTVNPATASPTAFPTDFPTASPKTGHPGTRAPTKYPTLSPTPSPATISPLTGTPSKNPTTASPRTSHPVTGVPTVHSPTTFPTVFPSKSPATATPLTANPLTANPATVDPTVFPTDSPTASPMTGHPGTRAPTKYPTLSPTPSPATNSPLTGTPSKNPSTTSPQTSHPITGVPTGNPVTAAPATGTPLTGTPTSHPATGTPITNEPTYIMSFKGRRGQSKPIPESNSSTSAIEKYAYKAQCCVLQIPPLRLESTIDTTSIKVSGISQCAATCNLNPGCRGMQVGFDSRNLSPKCELIMNFQKILNVTEYGQPGCTFTNEDYGSSRLSEGEGFDDGNIDSDVNWGCYVKLH